MVRGEQRERESERAGERERERERERGRERARGAAMNKVLKQFDFCRVLRMAPNVNVVRLSQARANAGVTMTLLR